MSSQMMMIMAVQFLSEYTTCKKLQTSSILLLPQVFSSKEIRAISPLPSPTPVTRRTTFLSYGLAALNHKSDYYSWSKPKPPTTISDFIELPNSGGVKALDLRIGDGDGGEENHPAIGDKVIIHYYYGRLAAKQGWRFDSTYDHKDENGEPVPFEFVPGSGKFFDRQRLFTTIFNPTRMANGKGSTLGTLVFDIELISLRRRRHHHHHHQ